jgi:DNA-binding FrmR family transcriptional regulator
MPAKRSASPTIAKSAESSTCVCSNQEGRRAVAVDPEIKISNLNRLRRIEGQIRGLQKMVEEERYCADIVIQISSVQEALRGVGRSLMRNHLRHCATEAIRSGTEQQVSAQYEELLELIYKHLR